MRARPALCHRSPRTVRALAHPTSVRRRDGQPARQRPLRSRAAGLGAAGREAATQHAADARRNRQHAGWHQLVVLRSQRQPPGDPGPRRRPRADPAERPGVVRRVGHQRRSRGGHRHADGPPHRGRPRPGHAVVRPDRDRRRRQHHRYAHSVRASRRRRRRRRRPLCVTRDRARIRRLRRIRHRTGATIPRRRIHAQHQ